MRWLLFAPLLVRSETSDPHCSTGILRPGSDCCCSKACGKCGGTSCQDLPGGDDNCCCSEIEKSGRSCAQHDPPCNVADPPGPPRPHRMSKRGFVADGADRSCDDPLLLNVSGWFYDYNGARRAAFGEACFVIRRDVHGHSVSLLEGMLMAAGAFRAVGDPYRAGGLPGDCALANATGQLDYRFVPMNWCLSSIDAKVPPYVNRSYFMGFNEPNNAHNCNTDAEKVATAWKRVMDLWPEASLVSPATAGDGIQWFDAFFGNCSRLYGKSGCRISHLAAHDYSCTASSTLGYLQKLHERYGYPVWLTEFSCGDHAQGRPTEAHLSFMREVIPMLDAAPFVERYAWMSEGRHRAARAVAMTPRRRNSLSTPRPAFIPTPASPAPVTGARDGSDLRGLVETSQGKAQLTELGRLYNSL